jgi:hypothetical protein
MRRRAPLVSGARLEYDKVLAGGDNYFPGARESAGNNERLTCGHRHRIARCVGDNACPLKDFAILLFGIGNSPFPDFAAPDARKETFAGIGLVHPEGLLWITGNQFFRCQVIRFWFDRRVGKFIDRHFAIIRLT